MKYIIKILGGFTRVEYLRLTEKLHIAHQEICSLKFKIRHLEYDLKDAQKNDYRDPKTGRFIKRQKG